MSFSSYDPHTRYKRRSVERLKGFFVFVLMLSVVFFAGFWFGGYSATQQISFLKRQLEQEGLQRTELEETLTRVSADAQTAMLRYEQLQESVSESIPAGPMQDLLALMKTQLDNGVDPKRLAFVIRSSRPPQNCTEPENRRFVVETPAYQGPESRLEIAEGAVVIKGSGSSVIGKSGKPEAWYDPARPVSVDFVLPDGKVETKSGVLPLQKYLIVGGREYRFTIEQGTESFARAVYDSCDYP